MLYGYSRVVRRKRRKNERLNNFQFRRDSFETNVNDISQSNQFNLIYKLWSRFFFFFNALPSLRQQATGHIQLKYVIRG